MPTSSTSSPPRRIRRASIAAAFLLVAASATAQPPPTQDPVRAELEALCSQSERTAAAEERTLKTYTSPALEKALTSEPELWHLLTDPATAYLDRIAAAHRGAALVAPENLQTLWKANAELQYFPTGVTPSQCEYIWASNHSPGEWSHRKEQGVYAGFAVPAPGSRTIFGVKIVLPQPEFDYPVTPDELNKSPWLWQTREAIKILTEDVNRSYDQPARYPLLVQAAEAWQPANIYETMDRYHVLTTGAPHTNLWLQTIVKLALDKAADTFTSIAPMEMRVSGNDSYHLEELMQAAQIAILQQTKSLRSAQEAAGSVKELATFKLNSCCPALKPYRTAAATLAIAHWVSNASLKLEDRYTFAETIVAMGPNPPFHPFENHPLRDGELASRLQAFEQWFAPQRLALEGQAVAERPHLQALAAELSLKLESSYTNTKTPAFNPARASSSTPYSLHPALRP